MTDEEVIVALGDVANLAARIDQPRSTVANWKERGIPWHRRALIRELAKRARVKLPADFLMRQAKRTGSGITSQELD